MKLSDSQNPLCFHLPQVNGESFGLIILTEADLVQREKRKNSEWKGIRGGVKYKYKHIEV